MVKNTSFNIGGNEIILNQSEMKALADNDKKLGELVKKLKELKSLDEMRVVVLKKQTDLMNKQVYGGKEISANYLARLKALREMNEELNKSIAPTLPMQASSGKSAHYKNTVRSGIEINTMIRDTHNAAIAEDELRKKSLWQLAFWGAVDTTYKSMTENSKVLSHYTDVIGAGLGFILDMILLQLMPYIIPVVNFLFSVGEWFTTLPEAVKTGIALVVTAVGALIALFTVKDTMTAFYNFLKECVAYIERIAGFKPPSTATSVETGAAEGGGAVAGAGAVGAVGGVAAGEVGGTLGLGATAGLLTGAAAYYYEAITNPEGLKSAWRGFLNDMYSIGSFGGTPSQSATDVINKTSNAMVSGYNPNSTTVNVFIGNNKLDKSLGDYNTNVWKTFGGNAGSGGA